MAHAATVSLRSTLGQDMRCAQRADDALDSEISARLSASAAAGALRFQNWRGVGAVDGAVWSFPLLRYDRQNSSRRRADFEVSLERFGRMRRRRNVAVIMVATKS